VYRALREELCVLSERLATESARAEGLEGRNRHLEGELLPDDSHATSDVPERVPHKIECRQPAGAWPASIIVRLIDYTVAEDI